MGGSSSQVSKPTTTTVTDAYKTWQYRDVVSVADAFKRELNFSDVGNRAVNLANSPIGSTVVNVGGEYSGGEAAAGDEGAAAGGSLLDKLTGSDPKTLVLLVACGFAGAWALKKLR